MATDIRVIEDAGSVVTVQLTRWPAYTSKAELLRDLFDAIGGSRSEAVQNIIYRLSNTDSSSAFDADKASRAA